MFDALPNIYTCVCIEPCLEPPTKEKDRVGAPRKNTGFTVTPDQIETAENWIGFMETKGFSDVSVNFDAEGKVCSAKGIAAGAEQVITTHLREMLERG